MVYSRQSLIWAAILCCAASAEPLGTAVNGTSRALLTISSTTSLPQQDISSPSTTSPSSTSSSLSSLPSSSVPTSLPVATFQSSSSSVTSIVGGPLPPPPISHNAPTARTSSTAIQTSSETGSLGSLGSLVPLQPPTTALDLAPPSKPPMPNNGSHKGALPITTNPPAPHLSSSVLSYISSQEPTAASISSSMQLNSILPTSLTSKHHNSSTAIRSPTISSNLNVTTKIKTTHEPTTTHHHHHKTTSSSCISYTTGDIITVWSLVPNTNTITITLYGNQSNTHTSTPEFTPPITCAPPLPKISPSSIIPFGSVSLEPASIPFESSAAAPTKPSQLSTDGHLRTSRITTIVITSKNPVTEFTTQSNPQFPGGGVTQKQAAPGTSTNILGPPASPTGGAVSPIISLINGGGGGDGVGGLPGLVVSSEGSGAPASIAKIGPVTIISIPTASNGGVFMEAPTPTVIDGVSVVVGDGVAVVGGSTFAIGAGAPQETIIVNNDEISIGPGGVGFADVTITPAASLPTNVVIYDVEIFSVVGASVAVFDGSSFTFTGGTPQTIDFNGDTIIAGPEGFVDGTSILGGPSHPTGTQFGLAGGLSISEIGSTIAVIEGTTLTVGPGATQTTATIDGYTITAGTSGLEIGGTHGGNTTLNFPFNPTTQAVTAGGITFSEIGSSLVNIGGTTFSIGPVATPTTDVYNGQTISIGPGGIGFATTTITSFITSSPTPTNGKKKNEAAASGSGSLIGAVLGACIALGVGICI